MIALMLVFAHLVSEPAPIPVVRCDAQTVPVAEMADAADDPAVWVHPEHPEQSLVIGTNKKSGLRVYDLSGDLVQSLDDGRVNNVDVIAAARIDDSAERLDLVAASNRSNNSIALYRVDASTGQLQRLGSPPSGFDEIYGLCGYTDPADSNGARVVASSKSGVVRIFRIVRSGDVVRAEPIREWTVGGQVEGLVADAEHGWLYVGEESVGVWKYPLDPGSAAPRVLVDVVRSPIGGHLAPDVEGLTIYARSGGSGWLIVSCQGEDRYAVYDRVDGRYVGSFSLDIEHAGVIDPVTHTDGITVMSANLGPRFPQGLFVAQDDNDGAHQNFKLASWENIAAALGLSRIPADGNATSPGQGSLSSP